MRAVVYVACVAVGGVFLMNLNAKPAYAVCKTMVGTHNGTDMFHETGAVGAALNKLMAKVEYVKQETGSKRVRMGRVRTKCGPWFTKYMLPHRHCVAKARVCY